ncbi:hypothetical protein NAEGRDRAFT_59301 [Naegleria gruberi]|uniref:Uncharacterized protein n=1 Tax=Naegleria gruberi TaxID=5762 RepID=D2VV62_NAEGR|nr:uncharacterized protein NAEGRDRAFT_59301 [Naegleria gruberi]EFC39180.1 hypothetical protein NAEGRDRAFT_59301 [Naegleria gruberi]|eukprot:XP_002671924.1 hypothetical protein NAEGRDRAFT_59301 [Naegleria gruberi strain NEG-M]
MSATTTLKRSYDSFSAEDDSQLDYNMCGSKPFCYGSSSSSIDFSNSSIESTLPVRQPIKKRRDTLLQTSSGKNKTAYVSREEIKKAPVEEFIDSYLKEKRKYIQQYFPDQNIDATSFTYEEVKQLLQVRDEQHFQELNKTVQEKLTEQFEQFTKFNHDYISKQFKESDFSYTS